MKSGQMSRTPYRSLVNQATQTVEEGCRRTIGTQSVPQGSVTQLKKTEVKPSAENQALAEAQDAAKSRAAKSDIAVHAYEAKSHDLQKLVKSKESEIQINTLEKSSSEKSMSIVRLKEELSTVGKILKNSQQENSSLQQSVATLRSTLDEYKMKNLILTDRVHTLQKDTKSSDSKQDVKAQGTTHPTLEKACLKTAEVGSSSVAERSKPGRSLPTLESENQALLQKVQSLLLEKACLKTAEVTNSCAAARSKPRRSLANLESENQELLQKVQSLQVRLDDVEKQHSQHVRELTEEKQRSDLEVERLKNARRSAEKLLKSCEGSYLQRISVLEAEIKDLQEFLEQRQKRCQKLQRQTSEAESHMRYLRSVVRKSLRRVVEDPDVKEVEIEYLSSVIARELTDAPNTLLSTPSTISCPPSENEAAKTKRW